MSKSPLSIQRLVAVFLAGVLLLDYPLLPLFNGAGTWFGIPSLYAYLFIAWAILVALIAAAVRHRGPP